MNDEEIIRNLCAASSEMRKQTVETYAVAIAATETAQQANVTAITTLQSLTELAHSLIQEQARSRCRIDVVMAFLVARASGRRGEQLAHDLRDAYAKARDEYRATFPNHFTGLVDEFDERPEWLQKMMSAG